MQKKDQVIKMPKPSSSKNRQKSRDRNAYSHKQLPQTRDISQIGFLEKRLADQITARENGYNQLLNMVKHLDETKKSKLPVQLDRILSKRILSPHKLVSESQQIAQLKAEVASFHSHKDIQFESNNRKIKQLQKQVQSYSQLWQQTQYIKSQILDIFNIVEDYKLFKVQAGSKQKLTLNKIQQCLQNQGKINALQTQFKNKTKNNGDLTVRISEVEKCLVRLQRSVQQNQMININMNGFISQYTAFKKQIQSSQQQITQSYKSLMQNIQQNNNKIQLRLNHQDHTNQQLQQSLQTVNSQIREIMIKLQHVQNNIGIFDSNLTTINNNIKNMQMKVQETQCKLSDINGKINILQNRIDEQNSQMKNMQSVSQMINSKLSDQIRISKNMQNELSKLTQNLSTNSTSISKMSNLLSSIQTSLQQQFQAINSKVQHTSKSITDIKTAVQGIFFNKNKSNANSNISLTESEERSMFMEKRIISLQKRMDVIYMEYLAMPIVHHTT